MKLLFSTVFLLFISYASTAGTESGGGGGALVCRSSQGEILSSHLLDLWEGKNIHNYKITLSDEPVIDQIDRALRKLSIYAPEVARKAAVLIDPMFKQAQWLGDEVELAVPEDAKNKYQKRNCPLEGMMYYDGDYEKLMINEKTFSALATNTDVAAAKIHEAVYYVIRERRDTELSSSGPVRKLVACIFSESDCFGLRQQLELEAVFELSDRVYLCENSRISFYLLQNTPQTSALIPNCQSTQNTSFDGVDWIGLLRKVNGKELVLNEFFPVTGYEASTCSNLNGFGLKSQTLLSVMDYDYMRGIGYLPGKLPKLGLISDGKQQEFGRPICQRIK
jgi:hypothetical protein